MCGVKLMDRKKTRMDVLGSTASIEMTAKANALRRCSYQAILIDVRRLKLSEI